MSRLLEETHEMAQDMYDGGLIDKKQMLEYEAMYRTALASEAAEKAAAESAAHSSGKPGRLQAAQT